ncbi:MAG: transposase, partial [Micromonosporaceae bacterium]
MAVVDDAGRLLASVEVDDTPTGYAAVRALIAERCAETGPIHAVMATDSEIALVPLLLAAAGEPLAVADDATIAQFVADQPLGVPVGQRRAVALARALQAGALAASTQPAPRDL